jgi:DNA polymerase-3 subunit epsilon/ATP-dependent DNA helicase DinG
LYTTARASQGAITVAPQVQSIARTLSQTVTRARDTVPAFWRAIQDFAANHMQGRKDYDERIAINRGIRVQPDWADIEASWAATEERIAAVLGVLEEIDTMLAQANPSDLHDRDAVVAEVADLLQDGIGLRAGLSRIIHKDERETVCWLTLGRRDASPSLSAAPLSVAETLRSQLFDPRESVVLTSATLSTEDNFDYIKNRLGYQHARELLLGSPFDYQSSTLILCPSDMPEPEQHGYLASLQTALIEMVTATEGRALALFTSHSGLRAAYNGIKQQLEEQGILVLGQGIDGAPRQLLQTLRENHRTLILGAASFWEGVDVTGEALSLLVMARLPFAVPSDPVYQARSELFDQPFEQFALPQAILRFKQGFGRLIRRKTDRGVMVVLDRRLRSRQYGDAFLRSLPACELRDTPLRDLPVEVTSWLARPQPQAVP